MRGSFRPPQLGRRGAQSASTVAARRGSACLDAGKIHRSGSGLLAAVGDLARAVLGHRRAAIAMRSTRWPACASAGLSIEALEIPLRERAVRDVRRAARTRRSRVARLRDIPAFVEVSRVPQAGTEALAGDDGTCSLAAGSVRRYAAAALTAERISERGRGRRVHCSCASSRACRSKRRPVCTIRSVTSTRTPASRCTDF